VSSFCDSSSQGWEAGRADAIMTLRVTGASRELSDPLRERGRGSSVVLIS
jgi:hypothetical protein